MFVNDQKSKQVDLRLIKELVRSKFDLSLYTYKESIYSLTERVLLPWQVNVGLSETFVRCKFDMFDLDGDGTIDAFEAKGLVLALMREVSYRLLLPL